MYTMSMCTTWTWTVVVRVPRAAMRGVRGTMYHCTAVAYVPCPERLRVLLLGIVRVPNHRSTINNGQWSMMRLYPTCTQFMRICELSAPDSHSVRSLDRTVVSSELYGKQLLRIMRITCVSHHKLYWNHHLPLGLRWAHITQRVAPDMRQCGRGTALRTPPHTCTCTCSPLIVRAPHPPARSTVKGGWVVRPRV